MDMALIGAQAAAQTLIRACQQSAPQNCFHSIQEIERSLLWEVLQRYQHVPALFNAPAGIAVGRR
jgi:electron transfer flavoprotein-quinone oxidoreductase